VERVDVFEVEAAELDEAELDAGPLEVARLLEEILEVAEAVELPTLEVLTLDDVDVVEAVLDRVLVAEEDEAVEDEVTDEVFELLELLDPVTELVTPLELDELEEVEDDVAEELLEELADEVDEPDVEVLRPASASGTTRAFETPPSPNVSRHVAVGSLAASWQTWPRINPPSVPSVSTTPASQLKP
jgi:hypothetical protein